jgi:hypothetical protein
MPRKLDAILTEAVGVIKPPMDSVEAFRSQLTACINAARNIHQATANVPPPGEMKDRAGAYLKVLLRTKEAANAVKPFHQSDDFLEALDREIWEVDGLTCLVVPRGSPQRDMITDAAAIMARDLIDPDPYRHPENRGKDLPAIDCPWRRPARLTVGGPWLRLASLIFEGATGTRGRNMMKYCREIDRRRQPRYVAKLHFQAPN